MATRQSLAHPNEIRVFENLEKMTWAAATCVEEQARVKAIEKKSLTIALSGGSAPKPFYELLGSATFAGRVRWASLQIFQVDERSVPPDSPQSNYRLIRQTLLASAPLPPENFHRMEAERPDRDQAAREYADQIARVLRPAPGSFPRFDLVFLGIGANGHTASLFPNSAALEEHQAWVVPNFVPELNAFRMTLTFPVLNAAANVIFLVSGDEKAEVVRDVLDGPAGRFPAQFVQPVNGRLAWWLDQGAARLLKKQ